MLYNLSYDTPLILLFRLSFWWYVIIGFGILLIIGLFVNKQEAKKVNKKNYLLLSNIDKKYEDFIQKSITASILENNSIEINKESLLNEALIILKPEISGLIASINSVANSQVSINYESPYFNSCVAVIQSFYTKRAKDKIALNDSEKESIFSTFKDAINSDISHRILDLKTSGSI